MIVVMMTLVAMWILVVMAVRSQVLLAEELDVCDAYDTRDV